MSISEETNTNSKKQLVLSSKYQKTEACRAEVLTGIQTVPLTVPHTLCV